MTDAPIFEPGKVAFKSCKRCGGDMGVEVDSDFHRKILVLSCIQCGHTVEVREALAVLRKNGTGQVRF
jgi:transcription elongation factor Elf1